MAVPGIGEIKKQVLNVWHSNRGTPACVRVALCALAYPVGKYFWGNTQLTVTRWTATDAHYFMAALLLIEGARIYTAPSAPPPSNPNKPSDDVDPADNDDSLDVPNQKNLPVQMPAVESDSDDDDALLVPDKKAPGYQSDETQHAFGLDDSEDLNISAHQSNFEAPVKEALNTFKTHMSNIPRLPTQLFNLRGEDPTTFTKIKEQIERELKGAQAQLNKTQNVGLKQQYHHLINARRSILTYFQRVEGGSAGVQAVMTEFSLFIEKLQAWRQEDHAEKTKLVSDASLSKGLSDSTNRRRMALSKEIQTLDGVLAVLRTTLSTLGKTRSDRLSNIPEEPSLKESVSHSTDLGEFQKAPLKS